jgi:tRNA threonylcarbamoyl adenosine modification protein YeaZ
VTLLAIDSSARRRLTVALADRGGGLVGARVVEGGPTLPALDSAIAELLPPGGLEGVVVATGPGSFTGLRAGMAAGLGVAHAARLPLFGVGSLEVVAEAAGASEEVLAIAGAGRGGAYIARYARRDGRLVELEPPRRTDLAALAALLGGAARPAVLERLPIPGVEPGDAAAALARAVPAALARGPLDPAGLSGRYLG